MNFYKGKQSQMLQTAANRASMYSTQRPLECNGDGTQNILIKGHTVRPDGSINMGAPSKTNGGEGSKGGKVIGHTKSGKAVYAGKDAGHKDYKGFSKEDHEQAAKLHDLEFKKHFKLRKDNAGNSAKYDAHGEMADSHADSERSHLYAADNENKD